MLVESVRSDLGTHIKTYLLTHPVYSRLYNEVKSQSNYDQTLMNLMLIYIENFCHFNEIAYTDLDELYSSFIRRYNKDLKHFEEFGEYPFQRKEILDDVDQLEYDVALLLSPIISLHRYRIMQLIYNTKKNINHLLIIGAGPGLELMLLEKSAENIYVIETNTSEFVKRMYPDVKFFDIYDEELTIKKFDRIYAIELLEHIENPYELIRAVESMLLDKGEFFTTTAINIPQFDHLINFDRNPASFLYDHSDLGFRVTYLEDIPHHYFSSKVQAANTFFIFKKDTEFSQSYSY